MDQGWSEILVFSYDREYEDDYDIVDGLDFVIYNVSPHYKKMPMQYTEIFLVVKNLKFH